MVDGFIEALAAQDALPAVHNPWRDIDSIYDGTEEAPAIRRHHLKAYLSERVHCARFLIVAEAMGYQGGHFSGIAITCERMLQGAHPIVSPDDIYEPTGSAYDYRRTSAADAAVIARGMKQGVAAVVKGGFNEPTDTVVWEAVKTYMKDTREAVLWNIFPFHPYKSEVAGDKATLTNRTPTAAELEIGLGYTKQLIGMLSQREELQILAVGRKAAETLGAYGIEATALRHPANGGVPEFRANFAAAMKA